MARKRYVDLAEGQMHVAEEGEGPAIVLLHWFPMSGRMYEAELPVFAELGWRAIAPDLMGLGRSDPRSAGWTVERHADALEQAVRALGVETPVVLGGHMTSQIAVELASRPSLRTRAVVLDGGPFVEPAALQQIFARMGSVRGGMAPSEDGGHRAFLWDQIATTYEIFAPGFKADARTAPLIYRFIADYIAAWLAAGGEVRSDTPPDYPMADKMQALSTPGVILTAQTEPLRSSFEPMCEAFGGPSASHIFPGDHPLHDPARAGEYAKAIDAALRSLGVVA